MKTALCSVSFRGSTVDDVVRMAVAAGLEAIEWGGDVHVPAGDIATAERARRLCAAAGLEVAAYGSYLTLGAGTGSLHAVLDSAEALGAPLVRVWTAPDADAAAADAGAVLEASGPRGITVGCEHHVGTACDSAAATAALMQAVPGLRALWQPLPGLSPDERVASLELLSPWLVHLHVFHWTDELRRLPLASASGEWGRYLAVAHRAEVRYASLEFVPDDSEAALLEEAATLRRLVTRISPAQT